MACPRLSEFETKCGSVFVRASMFESVYCPVSASMSASAFGSGWKSVCPGLSEFETVYASEFRWECEWVWARASVCGSACP